jgi:pantoate--beta-alanine ligase
MNRKKYDLKILTISKIDEVRNMVREWKSQNLTIGFVPTMGALHEGHKSLIRKAKEQSDRVIVSIFVNPTQFGPNEDFDIYPKTPQSDADACLECGADVIFAPSVKEMYVDFAQNECGGHIFNKKTLTLVMPPENFAKKLCGKTRTGHFDGVATVVLKLFNIVKPDKVFFGQKDAQQVAVIKKMCRDLNVDTEIIQCPIVREQNGLALSSRNSYLSLEEKQKASSLIKVLKNVEQMYLQGEKEKASVFQKAVSVLDKDIEIEYLEGFNAETLENVEILEPNTLIAIAAKISGVRLIDNLIL